ncbi:hypothetical protein AXG89_41635 (plasmid) [Burkholderia sp. PAMC 26561]|nr:hypothetical protein AXG89_41420 [Burkholderia sp. PAMC 26561]AMH42828.1 hypothetical protein AXG89_41635 [Burkholderia sp. PAMC 26561]
MHVSRAEQLASYGDDVNEASETKLGLEQCVRARAYFLWGSGGRLDGKSADFSIALWTSISASGPTRFGSKKVDSPVGKMGVGAAYAIFNRSALR